MVGEIYCAAGASQIPAAYCEPAFPEKGGISLLLQRSRHDSASRRGLSPRDPRAVAELVKVPAQSHASLNSHEFSYAIVNNPSQPGFVVLRNLPRRLCGDRLRDRTDSPRFGGNAVRKINLPATFEAVNVHDDLGFARGQFCRLFEDHASWADLT